MEYDNQEWEETLVNEVLKMEGKMVMMTKQMEGEMMNEMMKDVEMMNGMMRVKKVEKKTSYSYQWG